MVFCFCLLLEWLFLSVAPIFSAGKSHPCPVLKSVLSSSPLFQTTNFYDYYVFVVSVQVHGKEQISIASFGLTAVSNLIHTEASKDKFGALGEFVCLRCYNCDCCFVFECKCGASNGKVVFCCSPCLFRLQCVVFDVSFRVGVLTCAVFQAFTLPLPLFLCFLI